MRPKTHTEACEDETILLLPDKKVRELIGMYYPDDVDKDTWDITMSDEGSFFTAHGQDNAQIISTLEEVKKMVFDIENRTRGKTPTVQEFAIALFNHNQIARKRCGLSTTTFHETDDKKVWLEMAQSMLDENSYIIKER